MFFIVDGNYPKLSISIEPDSAEIYERASHMQKKYRKVRNTVNYFLSELGKPYRM